MTSPTTTGSRRITLLGLLAAYATALNLLEAPLPRILPWAKPGLANAATLVCLVLFGLREALLVATVRVLLAGFLLGHLLSPGWMLGAVGALAAALAMSAALRAAPPLGLVSVSAAGAAASNLAQVILASALLAEHAGLLATLPLLLVTAIPAGVVVAILAHGAITRLESSALAASFGGGLTPPASPR